MTDKRFTIIADYPDEIGIADNISEDVIVLTHRDLNSENFVNQVCFLLNKQDQEILRLGVLNYRYRNNVISYVNALNEEYEKADGELKEALGRVMKTKYEVI